MAERSLPISARHDLLLPHQQRIGDLGRDRPYVPSSLTDLVDVVDDQGVHDGQAVHYDRDSGLYLHQSRQLTFGSGSGAVTVGSTGEIDLPYNGEITTFVVRLKTPGSSSTVLNLLYGGAVLITATLGSGVPRVQYGQDPAQTVSAFIDTLEVEVVTAGTGAAGLSGYVLV